MAHFAATVIVDEAHIDALRRDVLMIARAADNVASLEDIDQVTLAIRAWRKRWDTFATTLRQDLERRLHQADQPYDSKYNANPPSKGDAEYYLNRALAPMWEFDSELGRNPRTDTVLKDAYGNPWKPPEEVFEDTARFYLDHGYAATREDAVREAARYHDRRPPSTKAEAEAAAVAKWKAEATKWTRRLRDKARKAWDTLNEYVTWLGGARGGTRPLEVVHPEEEIVTIAGFRVVFRGFAESPHKDKLDAVKTGLERYRAGAAARVPLMLKMTPPIFVEWTFEPTTGGDAAGYYTPNRVTITPWAIGADIDRFVKTLAHEVGHHLFQVYLAGDASTAWSRFIRGDYRDLNLREALAVMGQVGATSIIDKSLMAADPILHLQLSTLMYEPAYKHITDWLFADSIREYLEKGGSPVVRVPIHPITGYSGKNSEEAFCEALGNLVAYGPKAVPNVVLGMLRSVLGGKMKIAARVAAAWLTRIASGSAGFHGWGISPEAMRMDGPPFDRPSGGHVPLDQDTLDELTSGSDKVAARPIRIDRNQVDDLTRRIVDAMRREGEGRENEPVGVREGILEDQFTGITVDGSPSTVLVVVTSGRGSVDPFVSGGGFGRVTGGPYKGAPIILVQLDGRHLWHTFGQYEVIGKYLNNLLMHEITHAMDRIRRDEPAVSRGGNIPTTDDVDLGAYYNDPHEVRAYMRQIYEEIRPLVLGSMGKGILRGKWGLGGAIGRFLRVDHTWKLVSPHLTRENRNRILKGLVTAFEDDLPDVPLAPARVAAAWLTRIAWAGGACNPSTLSTAWITPEGEFIPVPPRETHSTWANAHLADDPGFLDQRYGAARYLTDTLGWVRLVNAYTLETGPRGASNRAMQTAVDTLIDCVVQRRDIDIELDTMTFELGSRTLHPTIADFVAEYGTSGQVEAMYSRLMSRTAASRPRYKDKKEVPKADGSGTTTVYQYGPRQVANRHKEKAERIEGLRGRIGDLRGRIKADLKSKDPETRLTALAIALIDATYERVGNDESADNGHYGVTGWTMDHITFSKDGKRATIKYVGKSGVKHEKKIDDSNLVNALKACCGDKGKDEHILSEGDVRVKSSMVNDYLRKFDITAKDLRGFHANREMQERLRAIRRDGPELPHARKDRDAILKDEFAQALEGAAKAVGHESSTLRKQYLVPWLEDTYMKDGTIIDRLDKVASTLDGWTFTATKSITEQEDDEANRLVRRSPKLKPSRDDSKRERMQVADPDLPARDKDLSLNYKDNG